MASGRNFRLILLWLAVLIIIILPACEDESSDEQEKKENTSATSSTVPAYQMILSADVPSSEITDEDMTVAQQIIEFRLQNLGYENVEVSTLESSGQLRIDIYQGDEDRHQ
jgi:hypothetical protein